MLKHSGAWCPDHAGELLDAARAAFVDLDARYMVFDTDVRRVEHLAWSGRAEEADAVAQRLEAELADVGPVAVLPATLARLRGWAAVRLGDTGRARAPFRRGLALAEEEGFDYEVALALDALSATGADAIIETERRSLAELVEELDIREAPVPPWMP